jgi:flagellin
MGITVNTNMQALRIQHNLDIATTKMNNSMVRMASGSKINSAKDDAAGLAVSTKLKNTISSSKVASDNVHIASDMLSSVEGSLNVISDNLSRIRDLTEQASNGTYSSDDLSAIASEVTKRITEIDNLSQSTSFNGIKLLDGTATAGVTIQIGTGSAITDSLTLESSIFASVDLSTLKATSSPDVTNDLATAITSGSSSQISAFLTKIDATVKNLTTRITSVGAAQNQLSAVSDGLTVQQTNLTSALSTIQDADIAQESAAYVQQQILQSASASLLVQANSAPQIALTLIKG